MQSCPHHPQFTPPNHNLRDVTLQLDMLNIAVSQSSPVIHTYALSTQPHIPTYTLVHSSVSDQRAPWILNRYGNQILPSQPWAQPMPKQVQPNLPVQAPCKQILRQPGETQVTIVSNIDRPAQTAERHEAIEYQRELEDQFMKRLSYAKNAELA
ncbi:hypothetical protein FRC09_004873 [Ceratobasidium sp. 395]|nr:hypothetical protein FRC09_004873 [Ceratobasidium sp. 395]